MKIITWNCNGALRNKFEHLHDLNADIYIVQECENPRQVHHEKYNAWSKNHLWIGDTRNKGLGIFASEDVKLSTLNWSNAFKDHTVKHFLPCSIDHKFNLLAVWTHQNNSPNFGYIGQFWKYLQVNKQNFTNTLIAGDFNSNVVWDEWDRWWNHSDVIRELEEIDIVSLYHTFTNEEQGRETKPTFYMHRKLERPYHIDFFFGSKGISDNLINLEISDIDQWLKLSDHLPMICEFRSQP
ncbi:hypothetical protein WG906_08740 [Pedobacter sp. P351]|uniref:hypothetical protein n=1 Tax=Pedobacter superstes TaxID=3133441 RepID=UPI0030A3C3AB